MFPLASVTKLLSAYGVLARGGGGRGRAGPARWPARIDGASSARAHIGVGIRRAQGYGRPRCKADLLERGLRGARRVRRCADRHRVRRLSARGRLRAPRDVAQRADRICRARRRVDRRRPGAVRRRTARADAAGPRRPSTRRQPCSSPGSPGCCRGTGCSGPTTGGWGSRSATAKSPHWTGETNSAATFGHFGQSGTFLWLDPALQVACVALTDRDFGDWAKPLWREFGDAVVAEVG